MRENEEIRNKISVAIDQYKVKEEAYNAAINSNQKNMEDVQKKLNEELKSGSIGQAMKALEKERDALTRVNNNCDTVAAEI